jgi:hypothetical protein
VSPLAFVNWRSVHCRFCILMWLVAGVLTVVILAHTGVVASAPHHAGTVAVARSATR